MEAEVFVASAVEAAVAEPLDEAAPQDPHGAEPPCQDGQDGQADEQHPPGSSPEGASVGTPTTAEPSQSPPLVEPKSYTAVTGIARRNPGSGSPTTPTAPARHPDEDAAALAQRYNDAKARIFANPTGGPERVEGEEGQTEGGDPVEEQLGGADSADVTSPVNGESGHTEEADAPHSQVQPVMGKVRVGNGGKTSAGTGSGLQRKAVGRGVVHEEEEEEYRRNSRGYGRGHYGRGRAGMGMPGVPMPGMAGFPQPYMPGAPLGPMQLPYPGPSMGYDYSGPSNGPPAPGGIPSTFAAPPYNYQQGPSNAGPPPPSPYAQPPLVGMNMGMAGPHMTMPTPAMSPPAGPPPMSMFPQPTMALPGMSMPNALAPPFYPSGSQLPQPSSAMYHNAAPPAFAGGSQPRQYGQFPGQNPPGPLQGGQYNAPPTSGYYAGGQSNGGAPQAQPQRHGAPPSQQQQPSQGGRWTAGGGRGSGGGRSYADPGAGQAQYGDAGMSNTASGQFGGPPPHSGAPRTGYAGTGIHLPPPAPLTSPLSGSSNSPPTSPPGPQGARPAMSVGYAPPSQSSAGYRQPQQSMPQQNGPSAPPQMGGMPPFSFAGSPSVAVGQPASGGYPPMHPGYGPPPGLPAALTAGTHGGGMYPPNPGNPPSMGSVSLPFSSHNAAGLDSSSWGGQQERMAGSGLSQSFPSSDGGSQHAQQRRGRGGGRGSGGGSESFSYSDDVGAGSQQYRRHPHGGQPQGARQPPGGGHYTQSQQANPYGTQPNSQRPPANAAPQYSASPQQPPSPSMYSSHAPTSPSQQQNRNSGGGSRDAPRHHTTGPASIGGPLPVSPVANQLKSPVTVSIQPTVNTVGLASIPVGVGIGIGATRELERSGQSTSSAGGRPDPATVGGWSTDPTPNVIQRVRRQ